MRILYAVHVFYPSHIGGAEKVTLNLAGAMRRAGHSARVLTTRSDPALLGLGRRALADYEYRGVPVTSLLLRRGRWLKDLGLEDDPRTYRLARRFLAEGRYDILHVLYPMHMVPFIRAAADLGIPYVLTLTSHFLICHQDALVDAQNRPCSGPRGGLACLARCRLKGISPGFLDRRIAAARAVLSGAAAVAAPSAATAEAVAREHPGVPIEIVAHGAAATGPRARGPRRYGSSSPVTFGYIGTLARAKGILLLLEAFRKVRDPDCRLRIFGSALPGWAWPLIYSARADPRVSFAGAFTSERELDRILTQEIDVLCVPSLCAESYSLSAQEALARRVPVIASRAGALPESVRHGVNGWLFKTGDLDALARLLRLAARDPRRLNRLTRDPRRLVAVSQEARRYREIYSRVLAREGA